MPNNRQYYKPKQANILTRDQSKYEKWVIKIFITTRIWSYKHVYLVICLEEMDILFLAVWYFQQTNILHSSRTVNRVFSSLCFLLFVLYLMGEVCLPFPMIPWCNAEVIEALALRVSLKYAGTLTLFDLLQK